MRALLDERMRLWKHVTMRVWDYEILIGWEYESMRGDNMIIWELEDKPVSRLQHRRLWEYQGIGTRQYANAGVRWLDNIQQVPPRCSGKLWGFVNHHGVAECECASMRIIEHERTIVWYYKNMRVSDLERWEYDDIRVRQHVRVWQHASMTRCGYENTTACDDDTWTYAMYEDKYESVRTWYEYPSLW